MKKFTLLIIFIPLFKHSGGTVNLRNFKLQIRTLYRRYLIEKLNNNYFHYLCACFFVHLSQLLIE